MKRINKIKLPDKPGVYLFKKNKKILYIGKATSLHNRVRSYMSPRLFDIRGPLVEKMVEESDSVDWTTTDSVLEAIILEAALIKKHLPKYNTDGKSDKSWNYVCLTKDKLPQIVLEREHRLNFKKTNFRSCYDPFPHGGELKEAIKIIRKIFPFLDDQSKNYLEFYRQINMAPDLDDAKMYKENIKNIKLFFQGKKKRILQNLQKEMRSYVVAREFEKAGEKKRQIFALKHINDVALLKYPYPASPYIGGGAKGGGGRIEAYDIAHLSGQNMVGVMTVVEDREVKKSEYKKFKIRTQKNINDIGALVEILERRLAHAEWNYPNLIVIDGGLGQKNAIKNIIEKAGLKIRVVSVVKDERHKPKDILGDEKIIKEHKSAILLANSEAHRFAIAYHKKIRGKNFLP